MVRILSVDRDKGSVVSDLSEKSYNIRIESGAQNLVKAQPELTGVSK